MRNRYSAVLAILLFAGSVGLSASGPQGINKDQLPPSYVPSGKTMYMDYCAACHGISAKGDGPNAKLLKVPPADLSTLARRHGGKFPYEYVSTVLRFGSGPTPLHGTADMPTWGPIFEYMDRNNERAVQQRIKNLSDYLASLQER